MTSYVMMCILPCIVIDDMMNYSHNITNGEVHDLYAGRNNKHMYMVKTNK